MLLDKSSDLWGSRVVEEGSLDEQSVDESMDPLGWRKGKTPKWSVVHLYDIGFNGQILIDDYDASKPR